MIGILAGIIFATAMFSILPDLMRDQDKKHKEEMERQRRRRELREDIRVSTRHRY